MSFTTELTKTKLYAMATFNKIKGRSTMNKTELLKTIQERYLTRKYLPIWKRKATEEAYKRMNIPPPPNQPLPPIPKKKNKKKKWSKAKRNAMKKQKYIEKKYFEKWRKYKRSTSTEPPSYEQSEADTREEHTSDETSLKDICELREGARKLFGAKKGDFVSKKHTDARSEAMCRMCVREHGDITNDRIREILLYQRGIQAAWKIHRDLNSWCRKEDITMKGTSEDHPFGNGMFFTFYDRNKVAKDQFFFSVKKSQINEIFMINTFAENGDTF